MAEIRGIKSGRSGEPPREPAPRRLAAIVAGDISGYSRLMEIDEEGTHRSRQADRARPHRAQHCRTPRKARQNYRRWFYCDL